jgi:hypothetical protein
MTKVKRDLAIFPIVEGEVFFIDRNTYEVFDLNKNRVGRGNLVGGMLNFDLRISLQIQMVKSYVKELESIDSVAKALINKTHDNNS